MSELKNEFISNMTHEFKTPISTISLACQALKDPDLIGEEYSQSVPFVTMIVQENKRLENLVEKILQSASIDRNDLILNLEIINLTHLLRELSANIKFRMRSLEGNLIEQFEGKELYIRGDRMHTTNMISNLLDNAIKYSKSSPTIVISLTQESGFLRLSIKDNGIGISKEHIGKVFDKLYRVPTGNVHNVKGFGLGLSYVKSIVSMHTWEVIAQSDLGKGSTFSIVFPDDSNTINLNT
jgi:two-component system phosphate regulon sensor histidine kinase PhoR